MHPISSEDVLKTMKEALDDLKFLRDKEYDTEKRMAYSIAITHIETAELWISKTLTETEG